MAHGVDPNGGQAVLSHVTGVQDHLDEVAGVAVAVDVDVEGLLVLRGLLGDDHPDLNRVLSLDRFTGDVVDVEGGIGIDRLGTAFEQEGHLVGGDEHVADGLEAPEQQVCGGARVELEALHQQILELLAHALVVDEVEVVGFFRAARVLAELAGLPPGLVASALCQPVIETGRALQLEIGGVLGGPSCEGPLSEEAVAQPLHVVDCGLRGE